MEAPDGEFTPSELREIARYISRRSGLYGEHLQEALADGLLALVERGGVANIRDAKYFAYIGAVDAHRRRTGRGVNPSRLAVLRAQSLDDEEVLGHVAHSIGVEDVYPSDTEIPRIVEWARKRPERTRRIVWLILQGYTFEQAGEIEGVSPTRVSQLFHGVKRGRRAG